MAEKKLKDKRYVLELTEDQMRVTKTALEEYFRLRMGQDFDLNSDMASINVDLSPENPNHDWLFDKYIARRDHMHQVMRAFFAIAFEPSGYLKEKTEDMLIAECIWDAMRVAMGISRWGEALQTGSEPSPKIEVKEE